MRSANHLCSCRIESCRSAEPHTHPQCFQIAFSSFVSEASAASCIAGTDTPLGSLLDMDHATPESICNDRHNKASHLTAGRWLFRYSRISLPPQVLLVVRWNYGLEPHTHFDFGHLLYGLDQLDDMHRSGPSFIQPEIAARLISVEEDFLRVGPQPVLRCL